MDQPQVGSAAGCPLKRRARIILKERRLELLDRAAAAAAADPEADVGAELAKAQTYERLIEALDGSSQRRRLMAAVIGIACVTVVGTAQVVRVPTTRVSLSAEADSATFTLTEPWLWETPASGASAIRLVAFDDLDLPALMAAELEPSTKDPLDFAGGSLTLASLSIAPNARVTLEADGGSTDLFVKGGHVAGELTLTGAVEVAGGMAAAGGDWLSARFDLPLPEIVTFAARPEGAIPAQLRIGRDESIGFFNVAVRTLSFARERASGTGFEFDDPRGAAAHRRDAEGSAAPQG